MLKRVVASSIIGAAIEWYDFFLYGVVAGIVFNKLYFPVSDPLVSTLLAYVSFAVGFITRPVGGIIFGHFGDRIGRKTMLVATLLIMGTCTMLIAFIPTYEQIGVWAPICLLFLRIVQGIGLGGEWGGAVLLTFEHAPPSKRGLYASLPQMGTPIGLFLSSGVVGALSSLLTDAQFMAWGWRIAFGVAAVLVFVGLWIRLKVTETPEFEDVKLKNRASRIPLLDMGREYSRSVLAGMGARYVEGVFFNIMGVFSITYLTNSVHVSRTTALLGVSAAAIVMCFFLPVFGYLSDRIGRTRVYSFGSLITGFSVLPAFWLMSTSGGHAALIWLSLIIPFGVFYAILYGPEASLFAELFDARVRYTGISFVYQFSGIFASGLTPILATTFLKITNGSPILIVIYVIFSGIVSALSARWIEKLKRNQVTLVEKSELEEFSS